MSIPYELVDVAAAAAARPTYQAPTAKELSKIAVGDCVRLVFREHAAPNRQPAAERLWVKVTAVLPAFLEGVLASRPLTLTELEHGAPFTFEPRHVAAIERLHP